MLQKLLGIGNTAFGNILLCQTELVKFIDYIFLCLGRYASGVGNLQGQVLNLFFFQMLKNAGGTLRSQSNQEYGSLLKPAHFIIAVLWHNLPPIFVQPVAQ